MVLKTLSCPSCHGSVAFEPGQAKSECPFCNSTVVLEKAYSNPAELPATAQAAQHNETARQAYVNREYEDALRSWDSALRLDPHNKEAYWGYYCIRFAHKNAYRSIEKTLCENLQQVSEDEVATGLTKYAPAPFDIRLSSLMRQRNALKDEIASASSAMDAARSPSSKNISFTAVGFLLGLLICTVALFNGITISVFGLVIGIIISVICGLLNSKEVNGFREKEKKAAAPHADRMNEAKDKLEKNTKNVQKLFDEYWHSYGA